MGVFDRLGNLVRGSLAVGRRDRREEGLREALRELNKLGTSEERRARPAPAGGADDPSDSGGVEAEARRRGERLLQLDRALEEGLITAEDYAARREAIVGPEEPKGPVRKTL